MIGERIESGRVSPASRLHWRLSRCLPQNNWSFYAFLDARLNSRLHVSLCWALRWDIK